jgi:hypothetical protein
VRAVPNMAQWDMAERRRKRVSKRRRPADQFTKHPAQSTKTTRDDGRGHRVVSKVVLDYMKALEKRGSTMSGARRLRESNRRGAPRPRVDRSDSTVADAEQKAAKKP